MYSLRINVIEGRIQRVNYIFDGFLYMFTAIGNFSVYCSMKCSVSFIVSYKEAWDLYV
jgi:hypothetical protein